MTLVEDAMRPRPLPLASPVPSQTGPSAEPFRREGLLLKNHVALVTGACGGIGKAVALALSAQGAIVHIVGRNAKTLGSVAASMPGAPERVFCESADLAVDESVRDLAARIRTQRDRLDFLIHCAGGISLGTIETAAVEEFDAQYRINLRAPYLLTQALLPLLRRSRGQIVFVNSSAGLTARSNVSQYAATKHGLKALADSLRDEVNADGVRVLSIFLGRTASPMQRAVCEQEGKTYSPEYLIQPEDVAAMTMAALALPRTAEVTEISIRPLRKP